ncbi:MAG: hypothetical protein DRP59_06120 [Spirochaetes bacterium]|nr:MAG: hypothetical protein DRP59_06120 [Spirochaetota bacterium]
MGKKLRDYKKLLKSGNKAQMEKLKARESKGEFSKELLDLLYYLREEVLELEKEVVGKRMDFEAYAKIRLEAADVANYAHMIIGVCEEEM